MRARGRHLQRALALLLLALGVAGCPALLSDNFQTVKPDASLGGAAGADASSDGAAGAGGSDAGCAHCSGTCCNGQCVDLKSDPQNCGACGKGCPGTSCYEGSCTNSCRTGFLDCDQNVVNGCEVNAATDPDNCGSCGAACAFGATCVGGQCTCPAGTADCDGNKTNGCETDLQTDPQNCGKCGRNCGPNQTCSAGKCVCQAGYADCNGNANDGCEAALDAPHTCGSCQNDCGAHSTCSAGKCGCAAGYLDCNATPGCETPANSAAHCGNCATACSGSTPLCNGTTCVAGCTLPEVKCGSSCVNLSSDPQNCGKCGNAVGPNQICVNGSPKCVAGFGDCNNSATDGCETDLTSNASHCGTCAKACKPGAICSNSVCQCAAATPMDCGAACQQCCNSSQCSDGNPCTTDTCTANGTCSFSQACAGGGVCCAALGCFQCCTDADCGKGQTCSGNQCVSTQCNAPDLLCNAQCVNPSSDPDNCGGCGNSCGPGRSCSAGQCTPKWVSTASAPSGFAARAKLAVAWTGSRVFLWGGADASGTALQSGTLYDPAADTFTLTSIGASTPSPRVLATAVWTGSVVVVWGGGDAANTTDYATGGRYDPATDTWQPMSTSGAPPGERGAFGVWTGSRVLIWGGFDHTGAGVAHAFLYDPTNDVWTPAGTNGDPSALYGATTGWSGTLFYVYGGLKPGGAALNALRSYDPAGNAWSNKPPAGPSARYGAFGGWDGQYLIAWGGTSGPPAALGDGERYDPTAGGHGSWSAMAASGAPSARWAPQRKTGWSARVSNNNLLVLGGLADQTGAPLTDGAVYDSTTNTWSAVAAWPSGQQHLWGAGVWTGSEFVLWGGADGGTPTSTGERFRP